MCVYLLRVRQNVTFWSSDAKTEKLLLFLKHKPVFRKQNNNKYKNNNRTNLNKMFSYVGRGVVESVG